MNDAILLIIPKNTFNHSKNKSQKNDPIILINPKSTFNHSRE